MGDDDEVENSQAQRNGAAQNLCRLSQYPADTKRTGDEGVLATSQVTYKDEKELGKDGVRIRRGRGRNQLVTVLKTVLLLFMSWSSSQQCNSAEGCV